MRTCVVYVARGIIKKVCLGADNEPRGVDPTCPDDADRNIIVWLDHRAKDQAKRINLGEHAALRTVGGAERSMLA